MYQRGRAPSSITGAVADDGMVNVKTGQTVAGDDTIMLYLKLIDADLFLRLDLHTQAPHLQGHGASQQGR
jgi:hypothetical protein